VLNSATLVQGGPIPGHRPCSYSTQTIYSVEGVVFYAAPGRGHLKSLPERYPFPSFAQTIIWTL